MDVSDIAFNRTLNIGDINKFVSIAFSRGYQSLGGLPKPGKKKCLHQSRINLQNRHNDCVFSDWARIVRSS